MNLHRYAAAGLRQYRRSHLPVLLGVALATAVLTGALLVGDSVRGSLRGLTLQRLGRIDQAVVTRLPFRASLADELAENPEFAEAFAGVDAALLLRGSLSNTQRADAKRHAGGVSVVGVSPRFADHAPAPWVGSLADEAAAITQVLAEELNVAVGDEILLRLPTVEAVPADSPLGEKADTTISKRLRVAQILPPAGLARFSLAPSQAPPRNLFLAINTAQELLDLPGKANALLIDGQHSTPRGGDASQERLEQLLQPKLEDYGLAVETLPRGGLQVASNQLVMPDPAADAVARASPGAQPVITYLANTMRVGEKSLSYSTITGVESSAKLGPLLDAGGRPIRLADDEIALNDWAAERLGASVGDLVTITFYEPESTHGKLVEAQPLKLKLRAIVPLRNDSDQPTLAADPRLTPELEGVTDADSINNWDLPFELVEPITDADEDYWDEHSTTPKAFVSLDRAKRHWATRWGSVSLMRTDSTGINAEQLASDIRAAIDPAELGFAPLAVKRQGLAASSGTTPFDGLFLGFSMFLIASSVILIALLFGLGVEQRSRELGLLAAVGWGPKRIRGALLREAMLVALAGVCLGVPAGVIYAWLMIQGLTTLWVEAIVSPFLQLHATPFSLLLGAAAGLVVAWLTIRLVTARLTRQPARALLAGQISSGAARQGSSSRLSFTAGVACLAAAGAMAYAAAAQSGEAQAGIFFGGGAALLAGMLLLTRAGLVRQTTLHAAPKPFRLWSFARKNVARNPGRSVLTIALVAAASFLILAISAFHLAPTEEGAGGFLLVGQCDQPLHYDLNTDRGRLELGLRRQDEELLQDFRVHALRLHDGEDASCLNLYQTRQPRVLGAPDSLIQRGGFGFAATVIDRRTKGAEAETWKALQTPPPEKDSPETIPVILDFNTARYSLKLYGGVGSQFEIRDEVDRPVKLEVVGLLKNSLLQGDLLISEANFLRLFPSAGGSRFFLIEPSHAAPNSRGSAPASDLAEMLEDRLSDYGMDLEPTERRLAGFLAVQNTYLSTFQTLGALGLLLGAVGVAVVQMRNVAERRAELALLQAGGFSPQRLRGLVLRENLLMLGGGLAIGALAAALALAPQTLLPGAAAADASLPWATSTLLLAAILTIGLVVGALATGAALRAPILPALRGD